MQVSQKCQYALRAIFELARRGNNGPVKIADIARAQAIPARFLEVILAQLKQGKFVKSKRGNEGGYELARAPGEITVGEIIRFIEGNFHPVACVLDKDGDAKCPFYGNCVFMPMWERVQDAISNVYDSTTMHDLVEQEKSKAMSGISCYAI